MHKYFKTKTAFIILLAVCSGILSCNSSDDEQNSNGAATTGSPASTANTPTPTNNLTLDVLSLERGVFDNLNNGTKMVFSHSIDANNEVKLSGWVLQGNQFPTNTKVNLTNGAPSGIQFGTNFYFSNVVLEPNEFNKIKAALQNAAMLFVIFTPKIVDTYFIGYDIGVSINKMAASVDAIADANPSPPRVY